jgi:hypothetical protein
MAQDSGLAKRGLLLLVLILALAGVVLYMLYRPAPTPPPGEPRHPELATLTLPIAGGTFPASINWGGIADLHDKLPDNPGWEVRYNAALALAHRGSSELPFGVFCQMLDENLQLRNFQGTEDGKSFVDEQAARRTVLNALKGLGDWHKNKEAVAKVGKDSPGLQRVYAAIDRLTHSENSVLKEEAQNIQAKITSGKW